METGWSKVVKFILLKVGLCQLGRYNSFAYIYDSTVLLSSRRLFIAVYAVLSIFYALFQLFYFLHPKVLILQNMCFDACVIMNALWASKKFGYETIVMLPLIVRLVLGEFVQPSYVFLVTATVDKGTDGKVGKFCLWLYTVMTYVDVIFGMPENAILASICSIVCAVIMSVNSKYEFECKIIGIRLCKFCAESFTVYKKSSL